jgi:GTP pyrophosphokinase
MPIIGYITQSRGITIHRQDCKHTLARLTTHQHRMIEVDWEMH